MKRSPRLLAVSGVAFVALTACSSGSGSNPFTQGDHGGHPTTGSADAGFKPSDDDKDPTTRIDGVLTLQYEAGKHVQSPERVAYDHKPPLGGAHDQVWATCNGVVYPKPVRTEHLVHSMEHGAVWISYDPDKLPADAVAKLAGQVEGKPYTVMSPYPGQPKPLSLQSWGKQLQVDSADDERVGQFIAATRANPYLAPEPGASCDSVDKELFDQDAPPPFDPSDPGPDAVPVGGR